MTALRAALVVALAATGCLHDSLLDCPGGRICPAGTKCGAAGDQELCVAVTCGNHRLDPGEACDDGNTTSGDGCPADCGPACGDGIVDPDEVCDDGKTASSAHCAPDCHSTERCGDGSRDAGEACDDGNLQSGDGCSSRCSIEVPAWMATSAVPNASPSAMTYDAAHGTVVLFSEGNTWEWDGLGWQQLQPLTAPQIAASPAAMVYDATRQRAVLFGDLSLESAWEWDGGDWRARTPSRAPPFMLAYGLAYDTRRQRTVLFGGGSDIVFDGTWEWNGEDWREIATPTRPAARAGLAMAYDARRGKVVMYGGVDLHGIFFDTWEYDGESWTQRATAGPPRSFYAQMAYDAAREKVVLFGGLGADDVDPATAYTWEWDGVQWTEVTGDAEPRPRLRPAMTYDLARRQVMMFGGQLRRDFFSPSLNDTWTREGAAWSERVNGAVATPPPRTRHAMVYEDRRTSTMLFGGRDPAGSCLGDTWVWSGASWRRPALDASPPARAEHAIAYDAARDRAVLFGGSDDSGQPLDDTWEWDGAAWRARAVTPHPAARRGHAMVYDAARGVVVLLGGTTPGPLVEHWTWDGTRWDALAPAVRPPRRSDFALAYDAARRVVVLFGGLGASGALRDVWEWDGVEWRDRTPPTAAGPAARFGHTLVYDAALQRVVLFGGHGDAAGYDDMWTWHGETWTAVTPEATPPPRQHHAMVNDRARRTSLMFGGDSTGEALNDLWLFRYRDPAVHREDCATGFDGDGDGKVGCDDPDCDELCATCGDGVCSSLESCRLCPADCGACKVCGDLHCDPGETPAGCPGDCAHAP